MKPIWLARMVLTFAVLGLAPATAFPNYFDKHRQWCEDHRTTDKWARQMCVTPAWWAVHQREDRLANLSCDSYRSRADLSRQATTVTASGLDTGRNLSEAEVLSVQPEDPAWSGLKHELGPASLKDRTVELLPENIPAAKLALRAEIHVGPFAPTIIAIGLESSKRGVMAVTANENGNGARKMRHFMLNRNDIEYLLTALNAAHFWQLPHEGRHLGVADGVIATIYVSIPGVRNRVTDAVGDDYAVDLSVLAHDVSRLAAARWRHIALPD